MDTSGPSAGADKVLCNTLVRGGDTHLCGMGFSGSAGYRRGNAPHP